MIRFSLENYLKTAALSFSSEDPQYPGANFAIATKPGRPWKTAPGVFETSWCVADLGLGRMLQETYDGTGFTGWTATGSGTITRTITTPGLGFSGTVCRRAASAGGSVLDQSYLANAPTPLTPGTVMMVDVTYGFTFKYRASAPWQLYDNATPITTIPANTGTAIAMTVIYDKARSQPADIPGIYLDAGQWVELDEFRVTDGVVEVAALIAVDVQAWEIQANAVDAWASPAFTSFGLTIARGPNGRFQHAYRIPTGARADRFWRFVIPGTTSVATGLFFPKTLGAGWLGPLTKPAHDLLYEGRAAWPESPTIKEAPEHGGWEQESLMGRPYMRLRGRRYAHQDANYQFKEWQRWLDIERLWQAKQAALVMLHDRVPTATDIGEIASHAWVMKLISSPQWDLSLYSDSTLEAREYA
jgi:hypothetical protein